MNKHNADSVKAMIGRRVNQGILDRQDLEHIAAYCLEKARAR